jgi:hypothetical protein
MTKRISDWQRVAKYLQKTTTHNQCWLYQPEKFSNYIDCKVPNCDLFESNATLVHRFVYAVWNDTPLKSSDVIMHTCHNRICINPRHLKLGTHKENNWRNQ